MFNISLVSETDLGAVTEVITIESLNELASAMEETNWAPSIFTEGRRTRKNFVSTNLLVLDIDEGCSEKEAKDRFSAFTHVYGHSRNHQKEKNGKVADRFRVALLLDNPITNEADFKATFATAKKIWPFIDEACSDVSRFFYPCQFMSTRVREGKPFSVTKASILDKPAPKINLETVHEGKGELWKSTLKLLQFGAKAGHRHAELIKAVGNLKEQNYSFDESLAMLEEMAVRTFSTDGWAHNGLSDEDVAKIKDMYSRESKYEFKEQAESKDFLTASDLIDETFEYLADKDRVKGEPTGLEGLDKMLGGGFRTGEITVLMAQAKTGKNALCHYLLHKAIKKNVPWGYASRELSPATEVIPNLLTIETQVNWWNKDITDEVKAQLRSVSKNWPLYFAPGYGTLPLEALKAWMTTLKNVGVNMFLFDHFHYALVKEDYEATSSLIKELKTLAKVLDIHLLMIVQPRALREGEKLNLATLRGGAAIGQALDNLLIMERIKTHEQPNISQLTLSEARHRLAKPGKIYLQYHSDTTTFSEVEEERVSFKEERGELPQKLLSKYNKPYKKSNYFEQ